LACWFALVSGPTKLKCGVMRCATVLLLLNTRYRYLSCFPVAHASAGSPLTLLRDRATAITAALVGIAFSIVRIPSVDGYWWFVFRSHSARAKEAAERPVAPRKQGGSRRTGRRSFSVVIFGQS
jgi:hypothetical protein